MKLSFLRKELESIKTSLNDLKPDEDLPFPEKYLHTLKRLCSKEFLKPFLFLNLILNIGLEWAGFPALAFYMHTILRQMEVPLDEYWVAVALAGYRSALTIGLSFVLYKVTASQSNASHPPLLLPGPEEASVSVRRVPGVPGHGLPVRLQLDCPQPRGLHEGLHQLPPARLSGPDVHRLRDWLWTNSLHLTRCQSLLNFM